MQQNTIILYYKYTPLTRPKNHLIQQRSVCSDLGLKGRILIASEGINGTLEGASDNIQKYIEYMDNHEDFTGINYKKSFSPTSSFPKLSVKVRREIVTAKLGSNDTKPWIITGDYLSAEELQSWFEHNKDFIIVDMRNDYEQEVGMFDNSIRSGMRDFKDLSKVPAALDTYKTKNIVTVCTGGVRCEKASGYLKAQGFKNVFQLKDGIVTYMEKFPNKHFKGKLYVFDKRIVMGFETESPDHVVIGKCELCQNSSENYINCKFDGCHKHYICCIDCVHDKHGYCSDQCRANDNHSI